MLFICYLGMAAIRYGNAITSLALFVFIMYRAVHKIKHYLKNEYEPLVLGDKAVVIMIIAILRMVIVVNISSWLSHGR